MLKWKGIISLAVLAVPLASTNAQLALKSDHGKYVRSINEDENFSVRNDADKLGPWEQFTIEHHGDKVAFRNAHGRYLCALPKNEGYKIVGDRSKVGPWELFSIERKSNGKIALRTAHGFYVRALPPSEEGGVLRGDRWSAPQKLVQLL